MSSSAITIHLCYLTAHTSTYQHIPAHTHNSNPLAKWTNRRIRLMSLPFSAVDLSLVQAILLIVQSAGILHLARVWKRFLSSDIATKVKDDRPGMHFSFQSFFFYSLPQLMPYYYFNPISTLSKSEETLNLSQTMHFYSRHLFIVAIKNICIETCNRTEKDRKNGIPQALCMQHVFFDPVAISGHHKSGSFFCSPKLINFLNKFHRNPWLIQINLWEREIMMLQKTWTNVRL